MKQYTVYYVIKMNGQAYTYALDIKAKNASDAIREIKRGVLARTGRNAFTPTTKAPINPNVEVIRGIPPSKDGF